MQPAVPEDLVQARALQRLKELAPDATSETQRETLNTIIEILKGKEVR